MVIVDEVHMAHKEPTPHGAQPGREPLVPIIACPIPR
jgi:hypothetical protein